GRNRVEGSAQRWEHFCASLPMGSGGGPGRLPGAAAFRVGPSTALAEASAQAMIDRQPDAASEPRRRTQQQLPRLAVNQQEAAQMLGVSVDFFHEHVGYELLCVYRGR